MKKFKLHRSIIKTSAFLSILSMFMTVPEYTFINRPLVSHAEQLAVIRGTNINVRSGAGTNTSIVTSLGNNTQVSILGQTTGSDGNTWYQISFSGGTGYVRSDFVQSQQTYSTDANFESMLAQQGFPESYKTGLRQLHAQYPNWVFKGVNTGLDWSTVIAAELQGTSSLIDKDSKSSWKSTDSGKFDWATSSWPGFDGATWVAASQEILEYYMDPRNFLDDTYIFQFTSHTYDPNVQTLDRLKTMVKGTFLEGTVAIDASSPLYQTALQAAGYSMTNATDSVGTTVTAGTTDSTSVSVVDSVYDLVNSGLSSDEVLISYDAPGESSTSVAASESASASADSVTTGSTSTDASGLVITDPSANTATTYSASAPTTDTSNYTTANVTAGVTSDVTAAFTGAVTVTYSDIIMEAAQQSQISPYVLAAMILQEQGSKGTSNSISGATGYYNYFNVGAYATGGMSAVERGLWYASQSGSYNRPWNTQERAIVGGALFYAENYLNAGQNTLYLKKFNVQGSNIYKHQYMTNTQGAAEEGKHLGKAYSAEMRNDAIEFYIPIYNNMPETACAMPTKDGNPNNKLASLSVDGFTLTPGFNMDTEAYTLIVDPSVSYVNVSAAAIHGGATITGTGQIALAQASNIVTVTVTAENGDQRNYQITINKAAGGQFNAYNAYAMGTTTDMTGSMTTDITSGTTADPTTAYGTTVTVMQDGTSQTVTTDNSVSVVITADTSATDTTSTNSVEVGVGPM